MESLNTKSNAKISTKIVHIFKTKHIKLIVDNCLADTFDYDVETTLEISEAKKLVEILKKTIEDAEK